jgi:gluconokinase
LRGDRGVVLACSALKASYRDILADHEARTEFVFLDPDRDTLRRRLSDRTGHFAGIAILPSQLAALERPEQALVVEGSPTIEQILSLVEAHLS